MACIVFQAVEGRAVLVAGDPEREHMAECERRGGIPYHVNVIRKLVSGLPATLPARTTTGTQPSLAAEMIHQYCKSLKF